jgi:hypothetical protein
MRLNKAFFTKIAENTIFAALNKRMEFIKKSLFIAITALIITSCGNDDDAAGVVIRDRGEVYAEDILELEQYLETHTYNYDDFDPSSTGDFEIVFDSLRAVNEDRIALADRPELQRYSITRDGIDYNYFVLEVRRGTGEKQPTYADSVLVRYKGFLLDSTVFDSARSSVWFDLPRLVEGFGLGVTKFNEASSLNQGVDGSLTFDGSGVGAVFMPSGLGYFSTPRTSIPAYSPIIFSFNLRRVQTTDHDGDGILSIFEDIDRDENLRSGAIDNTDGDDFFNYLDSDDDGDGIPTRVEISDEDGNLLIINGDPSTAPDTDGDGIPDYLDARTEV